MYEVTFRRIYEMEANSYSEAEAMARQQLHRDLNNRDLEFHEVFDTSIKEVKK